MPSMFKTDATTGALVREDGAFVRVDGLEAIAQHVRIRLRLFREEVKLDRFKGMRWLGGILEKGTPLAEIEGEFRSTILETPGIVSVDSLTLDFDAPTRLLTLDFRATASEADARGRFDIHDEFGLVL